MGRCGVFDAAALTGDEPGFILNTLDFGDLGFDYDLLTPGGQAVFDAGNLGGERYNLTNLRLGWSRNNVRFEGFVSNVFDEEYLSIAFQANPGDPTQFVGQNGAPRTYGVSFSVTF